MKEPEVCPYLTHDKLGIPQWLRDGLIKTLYGFKDGTIKELPYYAKARDWRHTQDLIGKFDPDQQWYMQSSTQTSTSCGTFACVLGWAAQLEGVKLGDEKPHREVWGCEGSRELRNIFSAGGWNPNSDMSRAISMLEKYLTTGKGPRV